MNDEYESYGQDDDEDDVWTSGNSYRLGRHERDELSGASEPEKTYRLRDGGMGTMKQIIEYERVAAEKAQAEIQVKEPEQPKPETKVKAKPKQREYHVYKEKSLVPLGKQDVKYWRAAGIKLEGGSMGIPAANKFQALEIYPKFHGTPAETLTFMWILHKAGSTTGILNASVKTISEGSGVPKISVTRAIHALEKTGWLLMTHKGGNGPKDPHHYRISLPMIDYKSFKNSEDRADFDKLPAVVQAFESTREARATKR